jgi:hypothetical protein
MNNRFRFEKLTVSRDARALYGLVSNRPGFRTTNWGSEALNRSLCVDKSRTLFDR